MSSDLHPTLVLSKREPSGFAAGRGGVRADRAIAPSRGGPAPLSLLPVGTLVIWISCVAVGVLGIKLRYPQPQAPPKPPEPVVAQLMHVQLTQASLPPPEIGATDVPPDSPPDAVMPAPAAPPLPAVAAPSPAIAFSVPVEGPARLVSAKEAIPLSAPPDASPTPPVQHLTYGRGEGQQPAPQYPRESVIAHEEGTVTVRFIVGENGRVESVEVISPTPYALLNQAAARTIRDEWRFARGPRRAYEVSIQFELHQ